MRKNKRICICCGNEYEYCTHCGDSKKEPRWKTNYDDYGCKVAFQTVTDYLAKEITLEEARENLKSTELKYRDQFIPSVTKYVNEILGDKKNTEVKNNEVINTKENTGTNNINTEENSINFAKRNNRDTEINDYKYNKYQKDYKRNY